MDVLLALPHATLEAWVSYYLEATIQGDRPTLLYTLCQRLGVPPPDELQGDGNSLVLELRGMTGMRRAAFGRFHSPVAENLAVESAARTASTMPAMPGVPTNPSMAEMPAIPAMPPIPPPNAAGSSSKRAIPIFFPEASTALAPPGPIMPAPDARRPFSFQFP